MASRTSAGGRRARRAGRAARVRRPLSRPRDGVDRAAMVGGDPNRIAGPSGDISDAGVPEGRRRVGLSRDRRGRRLSHRHRDVAPRAWPSIAAVDPGPAGTRARHREPATPGARGPMSCRDMRDRVQAYADDELGLEGVLEVEAHLERCQACREAFDRQRAFRRTVATLYPYHEPPAELARAVRATLRGPRWSGLTRVSAV